MTRAMLLAIPPLAMLLVGVWLARRNGLSIDGGLPLRIPAVVITKIAAS